MIVFDFGDPLVHERADDLFSERVHCDHVREVARQKQVSLHVVLRMTHLSATEVPVLDVVLSSSRRYVKTIPMMSSMKPAALLSRGLYCVG